MLKLCGLRSGYCRCRESCHVLNVPYSDKTRWHQLAAGALECIFFVPKDSRLMVRNRRTVMIRSAKRAKTERKRLL